MIGLVTQVVILAILAFASWGSPDKEYRPALSFSDGLVTLLVFRRGAAVLVVAAAACVAATRRWCGPAVASVLIAAGGSIGFLGFVLTVVWRDLSSAS